MKMTLPVLRSLGKSNNIYIPTRLSKSLAVDRLLEGYLHLLVYAKILLNTISGIQSSGHPLDGLTKARARRQVLSNELNCPVCGRGDLWPPVPQAVSYLQGICRQEEYCPLHG